MTDVVLHQWDISPYCRKVRKALQLKSIPFHTVDYNGTLAPRAARLSAGGKLPVLDWMGSALPAQPDCCPGRLHAEALALNAMLFLPRLADAWATDPSPSD